MSFYRRIKYFLVHTLMLSNKEAQEYIEKGSVEIDNQKIFENCFLEEHSEIKVNGKIARAKKDFVYLKFYKPRGFESTLSSSVNNNLSDFFTEYKNLAIAGRLDKESEGLLVLSNDGKWVEKMCNPKFEKEKEYLVELERSPDAAFIQAFSAGVQLGDFKTAPCFCEHLKENSIKVILKEGKNRQIRRMCHKLKYEVLSLKRLRIDEFELEDLKPGEKTDFYLNVTF